MGPEPRGKPIGLWIGVGAGVVVAAAVGIVFALLPGSDDQSGGEALSTPSRVTPAETNPTATVEPTAAEIEARQREALERLRMRVAEVRSDPDGILDVQYDVAVFQRTPGLTDAIRQDVAQLGADIERARTTLATRLLESTSAEAERLLGESDFSRAHAVWVDVPRLIDQSTLLAKWLQQEDHYARYAHVAKYWNKLLSKADKYLAQNDDAIAIAILEENIPAKYEGEFPRIWSERERLLEDIRLKRAKKISAASDLARKERDERRRQYLAAREKEFQEKWERLRSLFPWKPLLSPNGDLENFYKTVDRSILDRGADPFVWKNVTDPVDGKQVLTADTSERESEVEIGVNGNRWLDWMLEFEVQVGEGTLQLDPRNVIRGSGLSGMVAVVESAPGSIVLTPAEAGSWRKARLEVRGKLVRFFLDDAPFKELETENDRGGFRFVLKPKSTCRIKDLQIKWVNTIEPGEEDGSSEFVGEDIEDDDFNG